MSFFLETKQHTEATTIKNLRLETGWKFTALLIKETECTYSACKTTYNFCVLLSYKGELSSSNIFLSRSLLFLDCKNFHFFGGFHSDKLGIHKLFRQSSDF